MLRRRFLMTAVCLVNFSLAMLVTNVLRADPPKNDAIIPVGKEDNEGWMNRHKAMNERVKQGNVDLLLIGDSITHGWEGAGKSVWEKYYTPRNAVNLGIGGDRTQHILWRLDQGNVDGINPKLAVVMIGTNNSGTNTSEQIAEGIEAIITKLREKLPETEVLILGIFPRGPNAEDAKRKVNEGANTLVAASIEDEGDEMVHYLDIGKAFLEEDGTLSKEVMPDLLHLNEASYTTWAEQIESTVAALMGE
ncbi:MAG: platelet-activating factor acetylhydrolase IB subunit [Planctomycetota bacterium]|nr:platelet-activating factor acetylhydrolase IB subunit [Planctomycetota bacterium]MDA1210978.1 platelet-activating factor acetylhydrolase IB subunit [Planctomycetota bacterium]